MIQKHLQRLPDTKQQECVSNTTGFHVAPTGNRALYNISDFVQTYCMLDISFASISGAAICDQVLLTCKKKKEKHF